MDNSDLHKVGGSLVREMLTGHERFAVTGASGWLGRTALELLAGALGPEDFRRQVTGFASRDRTLTLCDGTVAELHGFHRLADLNPPPTHLLHFAFVMRNRVVAMGVPAYGQANLAILSSVVDAITRFRPRGVFCTSSGAVYEADGSFVADIETDPYGTLKRLEELAIRRVAADIGGRSIVTRVFSLGGAYMTRPEQYALGNFVLQALAGGPIEIRARGRVERSYCSAADVVAVALACLLSDGPADLIFDSAGEAVEMGELAGHVRDTLQLSDMAIERAWDPAAAPDRYVGDGTQMCALAARHGIRMQTLTEQIQETASYLGITDQLTAGGSAGIP